MDFSPFLPNSGVTGLTAPVSLHLDRGDRGDIGQIAPEGDPRKLKEACQGVESLFLNMMLKEMRKSIPKGGLFPDSLARDIYTSLFDQQLAQDMADSGGIGIGDLLYGQLASKGDGLPGGAKDIEGKGNEGSKTITKPVTNR